jgi:hypothetical protein
VELRERHAGGAGVACPELVIVESGCAPDGWLRPRHGAGGLRCKCEQLREEPLCCLPALPVHYSAP